MAERQNHFQWKAKPDENGLTRGSGVGSPPIISTKKSRGEGQWLEREVGLAGESREEVPGIHKINTQAHSPNHVRAPQDSDEAIEQRHDLPAPKAY